MSTIAILNEENVLINKCQVGNYVKDPWFYYTDYFS